MADWPSDPGFPQVPLQSGFSQMRKDNNIRSSMSYGPDKTRRRTTVAIQDVTAAIELLETELSILDDFYEANSSIPWNWVNFLDFTPAVYKFKAPPAYRPMGGQWYSVTLNLEIIP
jgi:hypothetical protein